MPPFRVICSGEKQKKKWIKDLQIMTEKMKFAQFMESSKFKRRTSLDNHSNYMKD